MGGWAQLADGSWDIFENVFNIQSILKTPPIQYEESKVPDAPRKAIRFVRREGLKPRKLSYEDENAKGQEEVVEVEKKPDKASWEDSGIAVWAATSSALRTEDVDKENRPESGKSHKSKGKKAARVKSNDKVRDQEDIIPNSQEATNVRPGSLRHRLYQWIVNRFIAFQSEQSD